MTKIKHTIAIVFGLLLLTACSVKPTDATPVDRLPDIYPDYVDVTIPVNIAPLNFLLRDSCDAVYVVAESGDCRIVADCNRNAVTFDMDDWRKLTNAAINAQINVTVYSCNDGKWTEYRPFAINVVDDPIDSYLTYRLIEPDYEVFSRLQIMERNVENFDERVVCDYNMVGNRCMNCHTYGANNPDLSLMYVRGKGGGMVINRNGKLELQDIRVDGTGSVYAQFSPDGRYIVFSTNKIIPAFHSRPGKRLEVFDTHSDVHVYDIDKHQIISSPLLSDSLRLETFPTFSPDGKYIYYCSADKPARAIDVDSLQYSLCRIAFDADSGIIGDGIEIVLDAKAGTKSSVCHPRISPDGRHMLYTVADYGTFPIWHQESDQRMLDLQTGRIDSLDIVNSPRSDTYHAWSSTGRWFVFASKRDDGQYGKPYFCHIDSMGRPAKPFVLPQRSPHHYDNTLRSFNAPELGTAPLRFTPADIAALLPTPN